MSNGKVCELEVKNFHSIDDKRRYECKIDVMKAESEVSLRRMMYYLFLFQISKFFF